MRGDEFKPIWTAVLMALFTIVAALWATGVRVYPGPKGLVLSWCAAFLFLASLQLRARSKWGHNMLLLGHGLILLSTISLCGALLSYLVLRITPFPFCDSILHRADATLGFDWIAFYDVHRHSTALSVVMQKLYLAIFNIPLLVVLGLALTGQERKLRDFLLAFSIGLAITIALFAFLPAITPLFYLIGEKPPYVPATGTSYYSVIHELRSQIPIGVQIHELYGIITFPSFHAVSAVLYTWAAWSIRVYRWPLALINLGMLIATPIEGAHYLVDVIAGVLVAVAAIFAVEFFTRTTLRRSLIEPACVQPV